MNDKSTGNVAASRPLQRLVSWLKSLTKRGPDPVYDCDVYIRMGCSHVDGPCCDMNTCEMLKKVRNGQKLPD